MANKPKKSDTKKKPARKGKVLNMWMDEGLRDEIARLAEEHHRPLNYEVELAIQKYIKWCKEESGEKL